MPVGSGEGNGKAHVEMWNVEGNFDVQVDFDLVTYPASSFWGTFLYAYDTNGAGIEILRGWYGSQSYRTWQGGWRSETVTGTSSGKFRITRIANTWTTYYDDGAGWVQDWTYDATTDPTTTKIYLSNRHGNTEPAIEANYDNFKIDNAVYDPAEVDDTFTGTNGDPPDPLKWDTILGVSPTIQSNALEFDTSSGVQIVESKYHISGDFDIQTDFNLSSSPATNSWSLGLRVQVDDDNHFSTRIEYDTARNYKKFAENGGAIEGATTESTTDTAGQLRITRVDDDFAGYYWDAGSWNQIGTDQTVSGMSGGTVSIRMTAETWNTNPTMIGTIDNFQINGADSITGWTDDTGEHTAQLVWDGNFKIVTHLADTPTGSADDILDSTSNENHGTSYNMGAGNSSNNEFGKYLTFDGTEEFIDFGDLFYTDDIAIEAVTNVTSFSGGQPRMVVLKRNIAGTGNTSAGNEEWATQYIDNDTVSIQGWDSSLAIPATCGITSATDLTGVEIYQAHTAEAAGGSFTSSQINDVATDCARGVTVVQDETASWQIGARSNNNNSRWFIGDIREVRISDTYRSEAWRKATYYSLFGTLFDEPGQTQWDLVIQDMTVTTSTSQVDFIVNLIIQNLNVLTSAEATKIIPLLNINDLDINTVVGRMKFWEALSTINTSVEFRTLLRTILSRTPERTVDIKTLERTLKQYNG
jgi:hypothetical protein